MRQRDNTIIRTGKKTQTTCTTSARHPTGLSRFGARWGQGVGLQGRSYAIPTMHGGTERIAPYVDAFIDFARRNPQLRFLVTEIGCGIAGFTPAQMAPLFARAREVENICLPARFRAVLERL